MKTLRFWPVAWTLAVFFAGRAAESAEPAQPMTPGSEHH